MDPRYMAEKGERAFPPQQPEFNGVCPSVACEATTVAKVLVQGWILASVIVGMAWVRTRIVHSSRLLRETSPTHD